MTTMYEGIVFETWIDRHEVRDGQANLGNQSDGAQITFQTGPYRPNVIRRRMGVICKGDLRSTNPGLERLTVSHSDRAIGTMIAHPSLGNLLGEITIMAKPLLPDELWAVIEPLLPK
jgi:hypothetical protein